MDRLTAIDHLPGAYALALRLREAGIGDDEVARRLGVEREAVGPLLRLAEAKLANVQGKENGMYGTVMIGKLKGSQADLLSASTKWRDERNVPGYVKEDTLFADDGTTVVVTVWFNSKEEYMKLADDPEQDRWWRETFAPLLHGEPQWIDGSWAGI